VIGDTERLAGAWEREREFHDALAEDIDGAKLGGLRPSELDRAVIALLGSVAGLDVLDAGCGQGDWTVHLLVSGARVTSVDLSPGMLGVTAERARSFGLPNAPTLVNAPLERSGLPAASFDVIVGRYVLHHLDMGLAGPELHRLLKPGGRALFVENSSTNPILRLARQTLTGRFGIPRYGTLDEHPLRESDIAPLRCTFDTVSLHYPVFEFFVLFDRQVLRFRYAHVSSAIRRVDRWIHDHVPRARPWSYRVLVELWRS
jgi:SAM-dependent methyltransferase